MYHRMKLYLLVIWTLPVAALEIAGEPGVALVHRPYAPDPLVALGGARCSSNVVQFQVVSGQLPEGVTLSSGGYFSGTPRKVGTTEVVVRAWNSCGDTARSITLRVDAAPILLLDRDSVEFSYKQGDATPREQTVFVNSTWRDMAYSIDAGGVPWIELRPLRGRTPTEDSPLRGDPVSVSIDPSKLGPGTHRAVIKATAWLTSNEPVLQVKVVVTEGS
jgi:hypothetical protein